MTDALIVDISPWSPQPPSAWATLAAAGPPWVGAVVKATEGRHAYSWFAPHWRAIGATDLLRGCYAFLHLKEPGAPQADALLAAIDRAGGWSANDLHPWIDVEWSKANDGATRAQVEDCTEAFAETVSRKAGRECTLYAGSWLRTLGITSRMGCRWLVYPAYTATLPRAWYEAIGWDLDSLLAWQCVGADGKGVHAEFQGVPWTSPIGDLDINVLTLPGGLAALRAGLWAERPAPSVCAVGPER
jgi:GH25 family lysozyme M1 (1,4-beta-N-acetylmuramidase)